MSVNEREVLFDYAFILITLIVYYVILDPSRIFVFVLVYIFLCVL